jgi:hypothetical protein
LNPDESPRDDETKSGVIPEPFTAKSPHAEATSTPEKTKKKGDKVG